MNPIACGIRDIVGNKAAESAPTLILSDLGTVLLSFSDKGVNALGLRNVAIELRSRLAGVETQEACLHSIASLALSVTNQAE